MIIKAKTIITNDESNNFYEDSAILIEGKIIKEIGDFEKIKKENPNQEIVDFSDKLVMPGLICAHSHCYSAYARGMSVSNPTDNFFHVLENLWWALDKKLTLEDVRLNALTTFMESIHNGVTTIIDHHSGPNSIEGSLFTMADAAKELGIRASLCYEVSDRDGLDKRDLGIAENINWIREAEKHDDMLNALFGLHASFTLSDETLAKCQKAMEGFDNGYHVHIAEGIEDEWETFKISGKRVVDRLDAYEIFRPKTLSIHNVHINEREMDILKARDAMAVFNPQSNMNNAVGAPPVLRMLDKNILLGLGTDAYTNDIFESMRVAKVLLTHESHDSTKGFAEAIKLLFENNPKIMDRFLKNPVGKIKEGAYADIIALDYDPMTPLNGNNWMGHAIFGLNGGLVTDSIINGKIVMKDREIKTIDQKEIHEKSRQRAKEIWPKL
ncbi:putative aminohydrolase SsnA [Anaerococcus kampingiae]|uniref:Aminohydrolase SsnA n=1 Tax=Anaerococcus kampingae TaxID=3115614 RepID=A0ABW9MF40_9FIRM